MPKTKVIYIASQERSGSTLISQILGQVPGFFSVGELYIIWRYGILENRLCGCGEKFKDCDFWGKTLAEAGINPEDATTFHHTSRKFISKFPWAIFPMLSSLAMKQLGTYPEAVSALYETVAKTTSSKVIVDASKSIVHYYLLSQLPNIDLYMLHLVRDPHGVEHSILKRKNEGVPEYINHNVTRSSLGWSLRNLLMENVGNRIPNNYLRVNYETFAKNPQQILVQVLNMLGEESTQLPFSEGADAQASEFQVTRNHVIAGSPKRFRQGNDAIKLDEAWKQKMSIKDKKKISFLTWPLLRRYGYSSML